MKIAISKGAGGPKYLNYAPWIRRADPKTECVELSALPLDEALRALDACDGLLLTGGPDVDPVRYGRADARDVCVIDSDRDEREYAYLAKAIERGMPVLGVCRGMQLMNVYFGGTLIPDIPAAVSGAQKHSESPDIDAWHVVSIDPSFEPVYAAREARSNSAHHQSVDRMATEFVPAARAADDVIEAMMPADPARKMFGVQWHPERMDADEPMSRNVGAYFLSLCAR